MRDYKPDDIAKKILLLAGQQKKTKDIAILLHIDRVIVTQRLRTLEKYGYINRARISNYTQISLTSKATKTILEYQASNPLGIPHTILSIPPITQRLHDLELTFKLLNSLSPSEPPQVALSRGVAYEEVQMHNHKDAILKGFELKARLYPTSLVVYAPDKSIDLESGLSTAINQSLDAVERVILQVEDKIPEVKVKRIDRNTIIGIISTQHIALADHPFAEWLRLNQMKIKVEDPDGGEPLLVFDYSHGHDELETTNTINGTNVNEGFKDMTILFSKKQLNIKDIAQQKDVLELLIKSSIEQNKSIDNINKAISGLFEEAKSNERYKSAHTSLIRDIDSYIINPAVSEEMRKRIHRRIKEVEEQDKQRRL